MAILDLIIQVSKKVALLDHCVAWWDKYSVCLRDKRFPHKPSYGPGVSFVVEWNSKVSMVIGMLMIR